MKTSATSSPLEQAPSNYELMIIKSREAMQILLDRHQEQARFDRQNPYAVFNDTVHQQIDTPVFTGIVLHNVYYDTGINPEADTGPAETLVITGVTNNNIVQLRAIGLYGPELGATRERDALVALDETLAILTATDATS